MTINHYIYFIYKNIQNSRILIIIYDIICFLKEKKTADFEHFFNKKILKTLVLNTRKLFNMKLS